MTVTIEQASAPTDEVHKLLGELDQALSGPYSPEQQHALPVEQLFEPGVHFFVARLDGAPAGCGGLALFEDYAELKRMYVKPTARGRGVADAILGRIEAVARDAGKSSLHLETGVHQTQAVSFYQRLGFAGCPAFGPYAKLPPHTIELSLFFEKTL